MGTPEFAYQNISPADFWAFASINAAGANNLSVNPPTGRYAVLTGVQVTGTGATAATTATLQLAGFTGTMFYYISIPAIATTLGITPFELTFSPGLPGNGPGVGIAINLASFGAGNTFAGLAIQGYYL